MEQQDRDFYEAGKRGLPITSFPDDRARDFYEAGTRGLNLNSAPDTPNAMEVAWTATKDASKAVADTVSSLPETISAAWNGEGQSEFPDMPEMTEIEDLGFFESFVPNMKLGLTTDPAEKARIVAEHFKGDPRFGGVFEDEMGNPIVEWNGQPYMVNKPGASTQDATDLVAQTTQLLPASKISSGARTLAGRGAAGATLYGATDIAQQAGTMAAGGKDAIDLGQTGTVSGVGGITEAVAPPIIKGAVRGGKAALNTARKAVFPRYVPKPSPAPRSGAIPMTEAQRSGDINTLRKEEAARQGGYGQTASDTMRGFDDRQMDAIRSEAEGLQSTGTGYGTDAPTDFGARLQSDLVDEAAKRKAAVGQAYDDAATLSIDKPARITPEGVFEISSEILNVPREMNIMRDQLEQMPRLVSALNRAAQLKTLAQNPRFKAQNFASIEGARKALNNLWRDAPKGSTEEAALSRVIGKLDDWTEEAITRGLMEGNEETIRAIQGARELARDYYRLFGKGKGSDKAGNAMLKVLDERNATPIQVANLLTGIAKTRATPEAVGLAKRMADVFGPDSEQVALLKDALLVKAFTGVSRGERQVTREAIVSGGRNLLQGDGKTLAETLFTPQERQRIKALVDEVARTITPADARNPSRSAWAMMQLLQDHNLLSIMGKTVKNVPLAGDIGRGLEDAGGAMSARGFTSQLDRLTSIPLVEAGAAASALGVYEQKQRQQRPPFAAPVPQMDDKAELSRILQRGNRSPSVPSEHARELGTMLTNSAQ